ncbi:MULTISPECIES: ATP-binding protein [unclassified Pseudomonas]|uniref:ATP-binding protein n=1 Tax=unclassified Pseudomonas TaxID=196821 RepID=UPI000D9751DE|nr:MULTISPECIES: ATP-binding protein [unclassified Pseudomonas]PYG75932.1 histidine kinase/DNA gyrase B/HSP90-like ATPase [Pseudomonas sp. RV120224-01c]PYG79597.1 histidine kinase/DNA gyrase B/HSP90-like ATPase [Pseudomonas sp. RV120224-01b]
MTAASLRFDGRLIEELSQKIPSSLFALNELIKNAYDAFSPDVTIRVEPSKNLVTVSDRGNGMGLEEIEGLFHISRSSKKYGHLVEQNGIGRITQGSKGLGFLAAFKFGDEVEWITNKGGVQSTFSLKKSSLVAKDDLSGTRIPIVTEVVEGKGTTILIRSNKSFIEELLEDLEDSKVSEKLAAAIIDETFDIKLELENKVHACSTKKLKSYKQESESDQLFYVSFDSDHNRVEFYHGGKEVRTVDGLPQDMCRTDYSIKLELVIFHFGRGKNSKSISDLNKRVHDDALYPLVYFNRNLFNNTVLFDPELLRKTSSGSSLPQMIGRVNLSSQSPDIEFNSDRTNFVDGPLTKSISRSLKFLNDLIQTNGSEIKKELAKKSPNNKVPTGRAFPDLKVGEQPKKAASILIDRKIPVTFYTPSEQIDLSKYIYQVKNSSADDIDHGAVEILIDNLPSAGRVLQSILEPCEKLIGFQYLDPHTGLVFTELSLRFAKRVSNVSGGAINKSLFTIESESMYQISGGIISSLIHAIDKAYQSRHKDDYLPIIASSIRCIFEISFRKLYRVRKSWFIKLSNSGFAAEVKRGFRGDLVFDISQVLLLLKKNMNLMTEVSEVSGIGFNTLSNLLILSDFSDAVKLSNVGAHSSSSYLTKPKIEECANKSGLFAVVCDVLVNLEVAKLENIKMEKLVEADFRLALGI